MRDGQITKGGCLRAVIAACAIWVLAAPLSGALAANAVTAAGSPRRAAGMVPEQMFLQQAQASLRRGDQSGAVEALEKGLKLHPRSVPLQYAAARVLAQQRNYPRARRHYEQMVKLAPRDIQGYFGLAQVTFAQRDYRASAAALRGAIRIDPRSAAAYAKLGRVYTDSFDTPRALDALHKALSLDPQSAEAQFYMGDLLLRMSRLDEARPYLERAVALAPGNAQLRTRLGDLFLERQDTPVNTTRALTAYQEAIRLDPRLPGAHYGAGRVYTRQRRWQEAEQELRTTLELDPRFGRAHYTLAQVCRRLGRPGEAAKHLEAFRRFRSPRAAGYGP